jgi:hypothetical protein
MSVGMGTAANGTNLLRVGGRMLSRVVIASTIIDLTAIGMCTTDYVPDVLYKVAKYDPF